MILRLYSGNWTVAASRYDRWLALDPQDVEAQLERAQLYDRLGQPARAETVLRGRTSGPALVGDGTPRDPEPGLSPKASH